MSAKGDTARTDVGRVLDMINGYQQTCVLVAALQLGLFERLAKGEATENELASELGAHAQSLSRLVRALLALRLVERRDDRLALASAGRLLLKKGFGATMRAWAVLVGEEYLHAWANLGKSVKTGETAFEQVFAMTAWEHRKEHPELNECFNQVTSGVQLRTISAVLASYDFSGPKCIVDVGGGHGNLVAGILKQKPEATGIVFDQPHVVSEAPAALAAAGVAERCRVAGGSFLTSVPEGGDIYVMKHVLHNWDDPHCVTILKNCRAAMRDDATLLVLENVIPEDDLAAAAGIVMLDIHMLAVLGGRERTEREYKTLFEAAGLRLARTIATREGAPHILEAKATTVP